MKVAVKKSRNCLLVSILLSSFCFKMNSQINFDTIKTDEDVKKLFCDVIIDNQSFAVNLDKFRFLGDTAKSYEFCLKNMLRDSSFIDKEKIITSDWILTDINENNTNELFLRMSNFYDFNVFQGFLMNTATGVHLLPLAECVNGEVVSYINDTLHLFNPKRGEKKLTFNKKYGVFLDTDYKFNKKSFKVNKLKEVNVYCDCCYECSFTNFSEDVKNDKQKYGQAIKYSNKENTDSLPAKAKANTLSKSEFKELKNIIKDLQVLQNGEEIYGERSHGIGTIIFQFVDRKGNQLKYTVSEMYFSFYNYRFLYEYLVNNYEYYRCTKYIILNRKNNMT